ncbi:Metal homeostatis protein BSD2, partial [Tolypocladium capitatum]
LGEASSAAPGPWQDKETPSPPSPPPPTTSHSLVHFIHPFWILSGRRSIHQLLLDAFLFLYVAPPSPFRRSSSRRRCSPLRPSPRRRRDRPWWPNERRPLPVNRQSDTLSTASITMSGRYERVHAHDEHDDSDEVDLHPQPRSHHAIPNSPPPSFHSRASSPTQRGHVDPDLADAFDADDASDDGEPDDRQRLVRQSATPSSASIISGSAPHLEASNEQAMSSPDTTSSGSRPRVMGGGIGTDGVFANMSARPERTDSEKDEQPPTYEQAAADAAPPYWETTIMAPGFGGPDEVYVDGMPVGSVFSFMWNGMISTSFQFVGFLLTYLLHSTHAAKNGSRAGLGITLIQYGFYMKGTSESEPPAMNGPDGYAAPPDPNSHDFDAGDVTDGGGGGSAITGGEWMSYALMVVGWFILIKSVAEFLKARRHEQLVMQSPDRGLSVPVIAEGETTERVV